MKWKIAASPTRGQSSERHSSKPAAAARGKLKSVTSLALHDKARVHGVQALPPEGRRRTGLVSVREYIEPFKSAGAQGYGRNSSAPAAAGATRHRPASPSLHVHRQ